MRCLNRNVLLGLGAVAVGILVFAPQVFGSTLPVLALLACPLSMVFMMRAMTGGSRGRSTSPSGEEGEPSTPTSVTEAELARLRSEVEALKADRVARDRQVGHADSLSDPT